MVVLVGLLGPPIDKWLPFATQLMTVYGGLVRLLSPPKDSNNYQW